MRSPIPLLQCAQATSAERDGGCAIVDHHRISIIAMASACVVVNTIGGEKYVFPMDYGSTVLDLKRKVKRQVGVPKAAMSIVHASSASMRDDDEAVASFGTPATWFHLDDMVPLEEQPLHVEFCLVLRYPKCASCGKIADVQTWLRCGRCYTTEYCRDTCQKEDWYEHKKTCCRRIARRGRSPRGHA
jgi:hypothetical protein